jgi:hypothetical protein
MYEVEIPQVHEHVKIICCACNSCQGLEASKDGVLDCLGLCDC